MIRHHQAPAPCRGGYGTGTGFAVSVCVRVYEFVVTVCVCVISPPRCLIKDFETRPSVTHLLEHPFIKQAHGKELPLGQQLASLVHQQQEAQKSSKTKTK